MTVALPTEKNALTSFPSKNDEEVRMIAEDSIASKFTISFSTTRGLFTEMVERTKHWKTMHKP